MSLNPRDHQPARESIVRGPLLAIERTGEAYYLARVAVPVTWAGTLPGQFTMIQPAGVEEPLLKRPYSIMRVRNRGETGTEIDLLIKEVGRGSRQVAAQAVGTTMEMIGPLGLPFVLPPQEETNPPPLWMVGGGIGVAPFVALAEWVRLRTHPNRPPPPMVAFVGGRKAVDLQAMDDLRSLGVHIVTATEDGSIGHKGRVTEPLAAALADLPPDAPKPWLFSCGPTPMMAAVDRLAQRWRLYHQVSLEAFMACGIGICVGCAQATRDGGYLRVCREGPCVDAALVDWDRR